MLGKYPGDALWALMVFLGLAFLRPRASAGRLSLWAFGTSCAVEFSQIYQAPWINGVRHTTVGHLVLGSVFSWFDIAAYAVGVLLGAGLDILLRGKFSGGTGHTLPGWIVLVSAMNNTATTTDPLAVSREAIRAFGQHYDYDVTYIEELMEMSPGAFHAFEAAMPLGQYQKAAPTELLTIARIAAMRVEDCGPCMELGIKIVREAGVSEHIIRGALHGGKGLNAELLDVYNYARAVAANEEMDSELLPRLKARWGGEVIAELAIAITGTRLYPTLKRALGHAKSCALFPSLAS